MVAPKIIRDLVAQYAANPAHYQASTFKETPTRQQFIDPFFETLGWNVTSKGLSEAEKEVVLEQTLSVGGSSKSIDYAFRLDGAIKFITEAKPPHKNLAVDKAPAIQVRRYGWNLGAPLGIVTDFEEFAVYDCRVQPDRNDGVKVARIEYIRYDEYDTRWDWIESLFSRDAVLAGSIDTWAATEKKRKGTVPVDAAFLVSINRWRTDLADDLVRLNPAITNDELNFAVRVDRLPSYLRGPRVSSAKATFSTTHQPSIYRQLLDVFTRADMRYNSGLFHFRRKGRSTRVLAEPRSATTSFGRHHRMYGPRNVFSTESSQPTSWRVYEQFLGRL